MANASRDQNSVTTLMGVSNADGITPVLIYADPVTHRLLTSASGGGSSPLTTKGDIYGFDTAGDRIPVGADGTVLTADSTQALGVKWASISGTGTVTSVATDSTLTGGPITTTGTLGINLANSNAWTATQTIAVTSATAFTVGQTLTNPAFNIDTSTASSATGLVLKSAATGGVTTLTATDSGANSGVQISSKGTGTVALFGGTGGGILLQPSGVTRYTASASSHTWTQGATTSAATVRYSYVNVADATLTLSTEAPEMYMNFGITRQHATGALTLQRDFRVTGTPHSFVAASTATDVAAFSVDGPSSAGTNATITNAHGIYIPGVVLTGTITNSYGLTVNPSTGATNNFAARFGGEITAPYNTTTLPHLYFGDGTDASDWGFSFAGGRGMVGYSTGDAQGNEVLVFNAGSGKGIGFYVNGTNATFLTGTEAMSILSSGDVQVAAGGTAATSVVTNTATQTLTNKRVTKRVAALSANSATPAINTDTTDVVHITAQTAAITSFTSGLTGTPVDGDTLRISITGTTAIALTWGTSFEASTVALPTTTVTTARLDVGFFWNTETSKWRVIAAA